MSVAIERGEPRLARARSRPWEPALAAALALVLSAVTVKLVLDAAAGHKPLVPTSPDIASWLRPLGQRLEYKDLLILLLVFAGAYAGLLAVAGSVSKRAALLLVGALHAIVFAGPILLSTDVFSYIAYARMGAEHGLNPYLHGPISISHDPVYRYVGQDWKHVATAYGPLYTVLSYPLGVLGLRGALWAMKLEALLASAATLWLVWRCARLREMNPIPALLAVGANPLYIIYALGGAHNDLIMMAAMMAAVSLSLGGRWAAASASVIAGALVKVTVAALVPFMLLARGAKAARAQLLGATAALAAGAVIAYAAFGVHGLDLVAALNRDAAFVSSDSFPTEIAHLFGKPGVFPVDHDLLKAALVVIVVHLLWRTWRGFDWIAAAGWTLLAISVTSTWLLAWYILWPLPLAVVTRERRL
ncbi:MAG TPA: polyprenol phosphomannose-dependent alpha 1,6 mannosyltransferase MptB, partial [Solirubrobacteraceae bacterium]|nr:polyprenol phosphomannose-dependent alpha 1,6 mannosyltransferase MptB [Solirubrobacteraceae bacterium]